MTLKRSLQAFAACILLLNVLFLWRELFSYSCAPLLLLSAVYGVVFYGLLEHRLERRRFAVDYYLKPDSGLRRWIRGASIPVLASLVLAAPLTVLLGVFAALSRPTDWYFLGALALAAPASFAAASAWPGRHFRSRAEGAARRVSAPEIFAVRLSGVVLFAGAAAVYWYANTYLIEVPDGIFPDSLERTLAFFAAQAASDCTIVETVLRLAAQLDALQWYSASAAATSGVLTGGMKALLWAAFFFKAAGALGAFIHGLNGAMLLACRIGGPPPPPLPTPSPDARSEAPGPGRSGGGVIRAFWVTILGLICASLALSATAMVQRLRSEPAPMPPPAVAFALPPLDLPEGCLDPRDLRAGLEGRRRQLLARLFGDPLQRTEEAARTNIEAAFAPLYDRIPEFLDWHYSVRGQYAELGLAAAGMLVNRMESELFSGLEGRMEQAAAEIDVAFDTELLERAAQWFKDQAETMPPPCAGNADTPGLIEELRTELVQDAVQRFRTSAVPGGAAALVSAAAGKAGVAAFAKAVSKKLAAKLAGSALVKAGGKTVAKMFGKSAAAAGTGAAAGALLGPLGAVAGVLGGVATWLAVDFAAVGIDEHFNRDALHAELAAMIDQEKAALTEHVLSGFESSRSQALEGVTPSEL